MSPGMHQYRVIDGYAVIHSQLREWHVSAILFRMFSDFGCEKKVRRIMLCCLATTVPNRSWPQSRPLTVVVLFIVRRRHRWRTAKQAASTEADNTVLLRGGPD